MTATPTRPPKEGRRTYTVIDSPIGPITLAAVDGVLSGLHMIERWHGPTDDTFGERTAEGFESAITQVREYFAGERTVFDLPLHMEGTDFQRTVWTALLDIPFGETVSYGELAERLGKPSASRAVGLANGRNPISIIVPCHRVIGADGSLTGYGGGIERKRHLLDHERGTDPGMLF
ncbi:methylated-DNA-[protein]-cysteine S-methyltransferase [Murinocardiopsis flavida]|uniref:Methylated-DNA--protein-cysteine methyltransferase n=1 Tax=Murinocardiopsis flavida TaxID=645275 RepID=A0A2P8C8W3_9ACTN|nr:methylated-DNA--[protein]-cysteine S-methyltransferase [Murinocardiopsis flavida]PSK81389.1 methylated-DNA-[protein]-cysteine S-methyltransferase [Murinocardiopsis flavida]